MMQRTYSFSNESLPVSEALFARLIRADAGAVRDLVAALPEGARARLALFCNARAHFRDLGHTIADTCSEVVLMREGGQAGLFLADRNKRDLGKSGASPRAGIRPITLHRATRTDVAPLA